MSNHLKKYDIRFQNRVEFSKFVHTSELIPWNSEAFKSRSHLGFNSILFQTEPNCPIYVRYNPSGQELDLAVNLSGFYCQTDVQLFQYLKCIKVKGFLCVCECVWGWGHGFFPLWYHSVQFIKHLVSLLLKAILQWLKSKKDFFFHFTSWVFSREINLVLNCVSWKLAVNLADHLK